MGNCSGSAVVGFIFLTAAAGVCVLSFVTDHWANYSVHGIKSHTGLVRHCTALLSLTKCDEYISDDYVPDYIRGCLAAMILGFLATIGAGLFWIMWMLRCCNNGTILMIIKVVTVILLSVGLALVILAVIVFAIKNKSDNDTYEYKYGWSWGLGILTAILHVFALIAVGRAVAKGNLA